MLRSLKDLAHYTMSATDGDIGSVEDFLLDDESWAVRYLVADTGGFLNGRRVLISPISFRKAEWSTSRFNLALTKDMIKSSPSVDFDKPVSRQHERDFHRYYGFPYYWGYGGLWGAGAYPGMLASHKLDDMAAEPAGVLTDDVHLRSAKEVRGYHAQGTDEAFGHIEDFIVDDQTWQVRYLVINTSNWWVGKKVLVAPQWAKSIDWQERTVHFELPRQSIKNAPEWNPEAPVNREYETRLYDFYGRPAYWNESVIGPVKTPPGAPRGSHPV